MQSGNILQLEGILLQFMFYMILVQCFDFLHSPTKASPYQKFTSRVQKIQNWSVKFEGSGILVLKNLKDHYGCQRKYFQVWFSITIPFPIDTSESYNSLTFRINSIIALQSRYVFDFWLSAYLFTWIESDWQRGTKPEFNWLLLEVC